VHAITILAHLTIDSSIRAQVCSTVVYPDTFPSYWLFLVFRF
jgi:hypothetical protein